MTNLPTDATETTHAARRRQLTRVLAVGALAAGAVVGVAVPAQATGVTGYHVTGAFSVGAPIVSDPRGANPTATLADGVSIAIDCGVRTRGYHHNTVWHHITSPVSGYIEDQHTDTPGFNRFLYGEPTCSPTSTPTRPSPTRPSPTRPAPTRPTPTRPTPIATPSGPAATPTAPATTPTTPAATPAPSLAPATRGATITYNEGVGGSCVYYALDRFHKLTGVYPKAFGDAKYLATGAAASGWTVSATPRVNSLVVFQPGQNGAGTPTGHVAWVEQVSGDRIYVAEMNAPNAWVVSYRWVTPAAGVRYVYAA